MYFQGLIENSSPKVYKTVITAVEKLRGYRVFIFRKMDANRDGFVSGFGNRGDVARYEEKPYIVGRYVVQGLAGFYFKSDRSKDTYNDSEFLLWFHGDLPVLMDSLIIVDRGKRDVDTVGKEENQFDEKGIDFPWQDVLKKNDIQSFLVTEVKNKQGWGQEILQFCKLVPKPMPAYNTAQ